MIKEVWKPDEKLKSFLQDQDIRQNTNYKWSQYILPVEFEGKQFLFNLFTKQCIGYEGNYCKDEVFAAEALENDSTIRQLFQYYFLVPADRDECVFYEGIIRLMRALYMKREYNAYTILPTLACNARCVYCYEEGMKQVSMDEATQQKTIDFILKTCRKDAPINLSWFGGEPLLGEKAIDRICSALTDHGVDYYSTMITNGSLLNESIVDKMCGLWKLKNIQVSMDGAESDYKKRKNYPLYFDTYHKVLNNVNLLASRNIRTFIRCNTDPENIPGMGQFIHELSDHVENKKEVSVYFTPLFNVQGSIHSGEIWKKCLEIQKHAITAGFRYGSVTRLHSLKYNFCMAENPFSSAVISPEGFLYNCEHCVPGTETGTIFDGVQKEEYLNSFAFPETVRESCRNCAFLPECTAFSRCPIKLMDCYEVKKAQVLYDFEHDLNFVERKNTDEKKEINVFC